MQNKIVPVYKRAIGLFSRTQKSFLRFPPRMLFGIRALAATLAIFVLFTPFASADENDTLFGRRSEDGVAGATPSAPATAQPDAATQEKLRATSPFSGTTWCYRASSGNVGTTEFRKNGELLHNDGHKLQFGRWEITVDPYMVNRSGEQWELSPDRKTLTQYFGRHLRVWYPGTTPPPPTARLRSIVGDPNVYWRASHPNGDISEWTFFPDGRWQESWRKTTPSGTWIPWYGDVLKYGGHNLDLFYLSEDGNSLLRSSHGKASGTYQKRYRAGYAPSPAAASTTTVSAAHAISGTKWVYGNTSITLEFFPDGKIKSVVAGKEVTGQWIKVNTGTVKNTTSSSTYSLSYDQKNLTQMKDGNAYVWRRVAGAATVAAPPNSTQTVSSSIHPATANPPAAAAVSAQSLRAEFETLNRKTDALFVETMRSYNRQDASSLEALKKRLGTNEIELLQKIQNALEAVVNNESFDVNGLPEIKKRTVNERALVSIKNARDRNLASAQKSVSLKSKTAYDSILKRATATSDLELAKEIKARMVSVSLSPVGTWRKSWGVLRIVIKRNGTWHHVGKDDYQKWEKFSPDVFEFAGGEKWKISPDGKTATLVGSNRKLIRE
jgi:hypothetical protein